MIEFEIDLGQEECDSLAKEFGGAKTKEQVVALLNRALDIVCEHFDRNVKEVKEIVANTQKRLLELTEELLKENEEKYSKLCDEVLEIEEEEGEEEEERTRLAEKLADILDDSFFTNFGDEFLEWFFNKLIAPT